MTETNSIETRPLRKARKRKPKKPDKPYPEFPLFAHATKRWAKKIRGKTHYFGPWADPDGAVAKYLEQKDALHAGLTPRPAEPDGLTVRKLLNKFLTYKRNRLDSGEINPRSWADYFSVCEQLGKAFGWDRLVDDIVADDFEKLRAKLAKANGPVRLGNLVQRVRSVFKFAFDAELIDKPKRFGPDFKRPAKKVLRLQRAANGPRMFERDEIHALLAKANRQLRAMILLGVNLGYGNSDVASLIINHLNLETGWAIFPRVKTGVERKGKLWPETIMAVREVLASRPEPKDPADRDLIFLTQRGGRWVKAVTQEQPDGKLKVYCDDSVSKEMKKLMVKVGLNGRRRFYGLRHSFETIGGKSKDQVAVDHVMGHADQSMAVHYREGIGDDRLEAVAAQVHSWLFAAPEGEGDVLPMAAKTQAS